MKLFILDNWNKIPTWIRKTILEILEISLIIIFVYIYNIKVNGKVFNLDGLEIVLLKGIMKVLRSHPEIPIRDYINDIK